MKAMNENLARLSLDIELIKRILIHEGELTDRAKKELAKAREENEDEYIALEDIEQRRISK
ncbi:hypothetical protein JYT44_03070 [Caldithrix abyssi]|nr:hypothetical protein [Caldithrix abyssi]